MSEVHFVLSCFYEERVVIHGVTSCALWDGGRGRLRGEKTDVSLGPYSLVVTALPLPHDLLWLQDTDEARGGSPYSVQSA